MEKNYALYGMALITVVALVVAGYLYTSSSGKVDDLEATIEELENDVASLMEQLNKYRNLTLVDDLGYIVQLRSFPDSIISLAPSNTEIVFAVGAGDLVVGVTDYCNYPHNFTAWIEAGNMTSIGGFSTPNMEAIVALDPELVLAGSIHMELVGKLRDLGIPVLVLEANDIDDILQDILMVGKATDHQDDATSLVSSLRERIDAVEAELSGVETTPRVYYEVWYPPIWTVGAQTFESELMERGGGVNVFADQAMSYVQTNDEALIEKNPEVLIFPSGHGFGAPFWVSFDEVKKRPGWDAIDGIKNSRLYQIDQDLISRAGPRIVDALEIFADFIHP
jgi:iron complex transport system substrate-binding protein